MRSLGVPYHGNGELPVYVEQGMKFEKNAMLNWAFLDFLADSWFIMSGRWVFLQCCVRVGQGKLVPMETLRPTFLLNDLEKKV